MSANKIKKANKEKILRTVDNAITYSILEIIFSTFMVVMILVGWYDSGHCTGDWCGMGWFSIVYVAFIPYVLSLIFFTIYSLFNAKLYIRYYNLKNNKLDKILLTIVTSFTVHVLILLFFTIIWFLYT